MARRKYIIGKLIKVGKLLVKEKLVISKGGNISAREGDIVYIKKKGSILNSLNKKDYICIDLKTGRRMGGVPSSEKYMHLACYKKRPDIKAVLHLHPVFSTAVANSNIKLGPISYELLACLGSNIYRARYKLAGSRKLAREIVALISEFVAQVI